MSGHVPPSLVLVSLWSSVASFLCWRSVSGFLRYTHIITYIFQFKNKYMNKNCVNKTSFLQQEQDYETDRTNCCFYLNRASMFFKTDVPKLKARFHFGGDWTSFPGCYPILKWCQIDKVDAWIGSLETITQHPSLSALLAPQRIRQNGRLPFGSSVRGILSEGSPTFSINLQTFCAQAALLSLPQPWVHTQSFRFN